MDTSANIYDLQFLTNPCLINKISTEKRLGISPDDIKFYKKRIFILTKNYLKGKKKDRDLDKISTFTNHAKVMESPVAILCDFELMKDDI